MRILEYRPYIQSFLLALLRFSSCAVPKIREDIPVKQSLDSVHLKFDNLMTIFASVNAVMTEKITQ